MADYFLHVEIKVDTARADRFETATRELLKRRLPFAPGWSLKLALKSKESNRYLGWGRQVDLIPNVAVRDQRIRDFETGSHSNGKNGSAGLLKANNNRVLPKRAPSGGRNDAGLNCHTYVHLWDIPDPPGDPVDIAGFMQALADDSLYGEINDLVAQEIQNLVIAVEPIGDDPPTLGKYLRVTRSLLARDLGAYLFCAGALRPVIEEHEKWHNMGYFQNITGPLNTVVEFWKVPSNLGPQDALADNLLKNLSSKVFTDSSSQLTSVLLDPLTQIDREIAEEFEPAPYWNPAHDFGVAARSALLPDGRIELGAYTQMTEQL